MPPLAPPPPPTPGKDRAETQPPLANPRRESPLPSRRKCQLQRRIPSQVVDFGVGPESRKTPELELVGSGAACRDNWPSKDGRQCLLLINGLPRLKTRKPESTVVFLPALRPRGSIGSQLCLDRASVSQGG